MVDPRIAALCEGLGGRLVVALVDDDDLVLLNAAVEHALDRRKHRRAAVARADHDRDDGDHPGHDAYRPSRPTMALLDARWCIRSPPGTTAHRRTYCPIG